VLELILTVIASKYAGPKNHFVVPACSRPGINESFKNRSLNASGAAFETLDKFLEVGVSERSGGTALAVQENS